jgi:hypothetical protein
MPKWSYEPPAQSLDSGPLERRRAVLDNYALRSIGVPERAVTLDGAPGSYAAAAVHYRVLLRTVGRALGEVASGFQRYVIDKSIEVNFADPKPSIVLEFDLYPKN